MKANAGWWKLTRRNTKNIELHSKRVCCSLVVQSDRARDHLQMMQMTTAMTSNVWRWSRISIVYAVRELNFLCFLNADFSISWNFAKNTPVRKVPASETGKTRKQSYRVACSSLSLRDDLFHVDIETSLASLAKKKVRERRMNMNENLLVQVNCFDADRWSERQMTFVELHNHFFFCFGWRIIKRQLHSKELNGQRKWKSK